MPKRACRADRTRPLVLVRFEEHIHALMELDALASVTVEALEPAPQAIAYIFEEGADDGAVWPLAGASA